MTDFNLIPLLPELFLSLVGMGLLIVGVFEGNKSTRVLCWAISLGMAIAILILPLFDTLRVFTIRLLNGKSPFHPDRNHIHHMMIDAGFTHTSASGVLIAVNLAFMLIAYYLQSLGNLSLLIIILILAIMLSYFLFRISKRKQKLA